MNPALNLVRIIGALALTVALGGCSAVKLGYDSLPQLAHWWLDGYFDFTSAQSPRVREELARLQQWHRASELPRAVDLLRQAERLAAGDITPAQACTLLDGARERIDALVDQAAPVVATFATTLTPGQLQHLARRYERNNAEFRKEWVTAPAAELRERRLKMFTDRLERVYGTLEEAQRVALRQQLDASIYDAARALAERQRRQGETLQVLRQLHAPGTSPQQARQQVQELLERAQASPDADYRRLQEALVQRQCALVAAVHNAATPAQRQGAVRRLQGWQRDLGELAAQK